MAAFGYSAIDANGIELNGEIHAPDTDAAREQLRMRGMLAQYLHELPAEGEEGARTVFKKVKPKSLQIFSRQFATMIDAGLSVVSALVILEEQTEDKYLSAVLSELRADVEGGLLLSQAMERHPKIFNRLYVAMVEAGEAAGILDQVLDRVAFQIEKETQIKRRVKGAMIYPTMVLIFATLVLIGMLLFLVPIFVEIFSTLGGDLPALTAVRRGHVRLPQEQLDVRLPGRRGRFLRPTALQEDRVRPSALGPLQAARADEDRRVVLKVTIARFSRTLSTLTAAGVDIIKALEITGQTAGNWVVEDGARGRPREGARGDTDRAAARRQPDLPADGRPHGQDR